MHLEAILILYFHFKICVIGGTRDANITNSDYITKADNFS